MSSEEVKEAETKQKDDAIVKSEERLKVIENIKNSVLENKLHNKVELGDPIMTPEKREKYIMHFDSVCRTFSKRFKRWQARKIAKNFIKVFHFGKTKIVGLENLEAVKTGAIITGNHYSKIDTTLVMYALSKVGKINHLDIAVEENNILMEGQVGFLMNNCGTIPVSKSPEYYEKNFMPSIKTLLGNKDMILIYPEEQMWFNYRKPRPCQIGAYHIATKFNVPIIPMFAEMREIKGQYDEDGFNKLKYILHIMPAIYPDQNKTFKEAKKELRDKDYKVKVEAYEKAYGKKLDYKFEDTDIAGLVEDENYLYDKKKIKERISEQSEDEE